jgi:succinoglycan biosynthesis protein ExoA
MTAAVIIPTLNEIAHIEGLLGHLLAEPAEVVGQILVADGGSTDGTREAVERIARDEPRVRLVDNPDRIQSAGVNRAVALADPRCDAIVRVDAHAGYPQGYAASLLASLEASRADTVVVRLVTRGFSCFQRAVAAAQNSRVGTGGSAHRMGLVSGFVDHGHHAAFRRAIFEGAGGYDTSFEANEDAELDARIRARGGRIWLDVVIPVTYYPRDTVRGLARQYFRYGSGRARTLLKHGERLRPRQMLPPVVLLAMAASLIGALVFPMLLIVPVAYASALLVAALAMAVEEQSACVLLAAPALATMHMAWGAGFLRRMATAKRQAAQPMVHRSIPSVSRAQRSKDTG